MLPYDVKRVCFPFFEEDLRLVTLFRRGPIIRRFLRLRHPPLAMLIVPAGHTLRHRLVVRLRRTYLPPLHALSAI